MNYPANKEVISMYADKRNFTILINNSYYI